MPADDEIQSLCLRVLQSETEEFEAVLGELKVAMAEHFLEIENLGIHLLLNAPKPFSGTETLALVTATKDQED